MKEHELAFELITACMGQPSETEFVKYAFRRLDDELHTQHDAYTLIGLLVGTAAASISAWAEDTDRTPQDLLQVIALANAADTMYNDDEE